MAEADDGVDFALAAYLEDGEWELADLTHESLADVETLAGALTRLPGEGGALGIVAVDEDFLIVRVSDRTTRLLLSDVTAADEWELAASAVEFLGLSLVADDEEAPAGDLALLADLGLQSMEMAELLDDAELYPDELLSEVARALGFGEEFDDAVGFTSA